SWSVPLIDLGLDQHGTSLLLGVLYAPADRAVGVRAPRPSFQNLGARRGLEAQVTPRLDVPTTSQFYSVCRVGAVGSPDRRSSTGSLSAIHRARPPSSGCTRVMP